MKEGFKQMYKSLKDDGLLIVFFAHSSTEAWNMLLEVMRESRFRVESSNAIHTENIVSVMSAGKTSFMSSIIISCRKILKDSQTYFEDLLPSIEDKVKSILLKLSIEELLELPIKDLLITTYGKVLEETTSIRYLRAIGVILSPNLRT